jgi:hypothetical protein
MKIISALTFFFAGICSLIAQEREFPQYNCAITPPPGWHERTNVSSQDAVRVLFMNPTRTRMLFLVIDDKHGPPGPMDDRYVAEFERGYERSSAGKRLSGKFIEVAGLKSYERLGTQVIKGKNASTIMRLIPIQGKSYNIEAMRFDGAAGNDPEIRAALDSFRFITPPSPPTRSAYETGYLIGRLTPIVMVVVAAIWGVLAIISRWRNSTRQKAPPPLPPNVR